MKKYINKPVRTEDNDFIWCVIETSTSQIIKSFPFQEESIEHARFLNNGGAFDGWTPAFFLTEVVVKNDLTYNQKFEAIFA